METAKADRLGWLMKCPVVAAKSWQSHPPSDPFPAAKFVLSLDPLCPRDDPSSLHARFLPPVRRSQTANLGSRLILVVSI